MNYTRALAVLVLLGAVPVAAQEKTTAPTPLLGAAPGPFVALSVGDLDRQVAWYRDTLGFTVSARGTVGDRKIPYAHLREGTIFIEMMQWPGARPRAQAAPGTKDPVELYGFFKGGFVVADVEALSRLFQAKGVKFEYELRPHSDGSRSFGLRDPEDNLLQFFGTPQADAGCPSSSDAVAAVLRRLIEADNARDLQTVLDSYTDDVVFLPPTGEVVLGKAAVAERYRSLFAAFQPHLTTSVSEVVTSGALAFVRGINSGRLDSPGGSEPTAVNDNYLAVLSCAGGKWQIARLVWTSRSPGAKTAGGHEHAP